MSAAPPDYSKKPLLPKWLAAVFLALAVAGGVTLSPDARQFFEDSIAGERSTPAPIPALSLDTRLGSLPPEVLNDPDLEVWESHKVIWSLGYGAQKPVTAPESMSDRTIVCDNAAAPWGDHGPTWGARCYNLTGEVSGLTLARVGDWTEGREGHGLYLNPGGTLILRDLHLLQNGGQAIQIAFRPRETGMPPSLWPQPDDFLELRNVRVTDNGRIRSGSAVRASWPVAIYATGQNVVITDLVVGTSDDATGALFVGPPATRASIDFANAKLGVPLDVEHAGDMVAWAGHKDSWTSVNGYFRTETVVVTRLDVEVVDSDREEVHFRNVGTIVMDEPRIVTIDEKGVAHPGEIVVADDCAFLEIKDAQSDILVLFTQATDPHRRYGAPRVTVKAGESFVWDNPED